MQDLSRHLRNPVVTDSQKWNFIEKAKFELFNYCSETAVQFLAKHKLNI